ncbi:hypothetical protein BJ165DRAFT_84946 [Panaeolus papilionaceus]|nr:hypothetical protein BJ165DRAFT_84946 [Panaeolus papilionaceus]
MSNSEATNNMQRHHDQQGRNVGIIDGQGNISPITPPPAYAVLPPGIPGGPAHYEARLPQGYQFVPHYGHPQGHHYANVYQHLGQGHQTLYSPSPIPIHFTGPPPPILPTMYGYDGMGVADQRAWKRFISTLFIAIVSYIGVGIMVRVGMVYY